MFKLIEALGRLVIALYVREAKALDASAKAKSRASTRLAAEADKAMQGARKDITEAAKVALKAQKLKEFF